MTSSNTSSAVFSTSSKACNRLLMYMSQLEILMNKDEALFHQNDIALTRIHVDQKEEITLAYRRELSNLFKSSEVQSLHPLERKMFAKIFKNFAEKLRQNLQLLDAQEKELTDRLNSHYQILRDEHTRPSAFYNRQGTASYILKSAQLSAKI